MVNTEGTHSPGKLLSSFYVSITRASISLVRLTLLVTLSDSHAYISLFPKDSLVFGVIFLTQTPSTQKHNSLFYCLNLTSDLFWFTLNHHILCVAIAHLLTLILSNHRYHLIKLPYRCGQPLPSPLLFPLLCSDTPSNCSDLDSAALLCIQHRAGWLVSWNGTNEVARCCFLFLRLGYLHAFVQHVGKREMKALRATEELQTYALNWLSAVLYCSTRISRSVRQRQRKWTPGEGSMMTRQLQHEFSTNTNCVRAVHPSGCIWWDVRQPCYSLVEYWHFIAINGKHAVSLFHSVQVWPKRL